MQSFTFKAAGVRRSNHTLTTSETEFRAQDIANAMEHSRQNIIPQLEAEMVSLESGTILASGKVEALYDFRQKAWTVGDVPYDDRPVFQGFSKNQMIPAFDLVKDKEHWKNPIDAIVPKDVDLALIGAAVGFFTGSVIETEEVAEGFRVTANGYFVDIGA